MIRKIIKIDEEKCNGCGLCATACHEGAITMVDGKAKILRDDYCDGLGDCLPVCEVGAIHFEEREAVAYNEAAVKETLLCGCPSSSVTSSQLSQWPVQIKLVPANASYLEGAHLLIAADCTAYAYADFHERFMKNRIVLIGCPKLDEGDYTDKLTQILIQNEVKSVTIVRMEVPCCTGIANAAIKALKDCGKMIPWQVVTISTDGFIIQDGMR